MKGSISTLLLLAIIGLLGYLAWDHFTDPVIHWDSTTDLEVIAGSYHDGIFRAWSKEQVARDPSGKATPGFVVTIEINCRTAQFKNVAYKLKDGHADQLDAPWASIQPDTAEARLLAEGCKNRK